jgi:hypothetical protein
MLLDQRKHHAYRPCGQVLLAKVPEAMLTKQKRPSFLDRFHWPYGPSPCLAPASPCRIGTVAAVFVDRRQLEPLALRFVPVMR